MWLLLFLLFSKVLADEERPACATGEMLAKCRMISDWAPAKCADGVTPECEATGRAGISCPSCIPLEKVINNVLDIMADIPPTKRCFVEGMVQRCLLSGVPVGLCKEDRPTCERKEMSWGDKDGHQMPTEMSMPSMEYNISCPTCVPIDYLHHLCKERPNNPCPGDSKPDMVWEKSKRSLCPSCFRIPTTDECGPEKRKECAEKLKGRQLDKCVDREVPMKKDCCFSCIPAKMPKDAKKKKDMMETCIKKVKNLPECEEESEGGGDAREGGRKVGARDQDGCRSCAPPAPGRALGQKCSIEDFRKCKENTPNCDVEEEPLTDAENPRCCPPCVRAASKVHLLRVIACRKLLPECDDDDGSKRNTFLPGDACPICEPKRPACAKACGANSVCIRDRSDGPERKKCVKKRRIKMILKLRPNVTEAIKTADKATMTRVMKELVSRFCERNAEVDRCMKFKEKVLDSLECVKKKNREESENEVEIEVEHAGEDESSESRRLLADSDAVEQFVNDATKDDSDYVETSTLTSLENSDDNSASTPNIFFISVFLSILSFSRF